MKREIPIYQYHDAWQILGMSYRDNGVVLDAASEEIMLRIENEMSRLKVMGDDDSRYFWIWAQTNNRERKWLRVRTAHYKGFHYLTLSDGRYEMAVLQNAESVYSNNELYREDLKAPLLALEKHVIAVVDWISEAPEEYNAYVERYLPYHKRSGDIPRRVLYSIDPDWHDSKDEGGWRLSRHQNQVNMTRLPFGYTSLFGLQPSASLPGLGAKEVMIGMISRD